MNKITSNLQTTDRITLLFTVLNLLSLIILLVGVNIIYFFSWYSDQKEESMYDMNMNYNIYNSGKSETNLEAFKEYILQKDTLIIPNDNGELICSNGVETKIHNDIEKIKDKLFYSNGGKVFFIYSQYYEEIGEVKVFFDTTPYVKSQILIIKISLIIIAFLIVIYYFITKIMTGRALKNMKQFITDVSHEFKTPLMVINSQIDLYNKKLEKEKISEGDTEKLLTKIKCKTSNLNNLLETFILLSRIENKIEKLNTKEVELDKYLKQKTDNYILNNDLDVTINYNLQENTKLNLENSTFNIIFQNILSNAIKFSNKEIKIEIGCNENSFWIEDCGVGIEKNKLNKVWHKFYRNDTNKEGFGVGLFIVKRLVELHDWKIEVESEVGKGTKFIIKF